MYAGGEFYGIRRVFLEYAGLPWWLPLPVAVQHGWQLAATRFEQNSNPPEVWVWSSRIGKEFITSGYAKNVRPVGAPFAYLLKHLEFKNPKVLSGSVCIPPHSTHFTKTNYSIADYVNHIKKLGDEFAPFTVMLYYLDMCDDVVNEYKSHGFDVVCNGSLNNDDFLINFIRNTSGKKYCISGVIGSAPLFCGLLGLQTVSINIDVRIDNNGNESLNQSFFNRCNEVLYENNMAERIGTEEFMRSELGLDYVLSRQQMRRLILRQYLKPKVLLKLIKLGVKNSMKLIGLRKRASLDEAL